MSCNTKTKYTINPFTGKLDAYKLQDSIERANYVVETRTCLASASVGELVVESEVFVNRVDTVTDNNDLRPVFAVIIEKTSATDCVILLLGQIAGFSGLTKGHKVFLSETGSFTSTPPTTGYLQSLGVAKEDSIVDFRPNLQRVKRV